MNLKEFTPSELASLKAQVDQEATERLGYAPEVVFRCPGANVVRDGREVHEACDFVSPTLAGVCPEHQVHVA